MFRPFALVAMLAITGITTLATVGVTAQTPTAEPGDEVYKPSMGQAGKDVIWIPTPDALVTAMLTAAKVTKDDIVYDLGSGDGRIPIAAAKQFGARSHRHRVRAGNGRARAAQRTRNGVDGRVRIITGDIFKEDFSKATVVTMYLLPDLNLKLRPLLLNMKPGTRVTSHAFNMGDWEPDEYLSVEARDAYLWYVPARVEGTWAFKEDAMSTEGTLTLIQRYQRVGGTVTTGGKTQPVLGPSLRGDKLSFGYIDGEGLLRTAHVVVEDQQFKGVLSGRSFGKININGTRR